MSKYSPKEEQANIISHAIGLGLSFIALILLIIKASSHGGVKEIASFSIFGMSMIVLYAASTIYHKEEDLEKRKKLRIVDHAAIYVLIAGSYTPFTMITLTDSMGWLVFGIAWGAALVGIVLKIFFTGKFTLISTLMYTLMGCIVFVDINALTEKLPLEGLQWLFGGGVLYIIGAIAYVFKNVKFTHAIFHVFVLLGSFCHFMSIYLYVLE